MITDKLIELMDMYNDAHGYSKEINKFIEFLKTVDDKTINASREDKEAYIDKYLEIYGNC
jgi:hypothetical protein